MRRSGPPPRPSHDRRSGRRRARSQIASWSKKETPSIAPRAHAMRGSLPAPLITLSLLAPAALALGPAGETPRYLVGFHEWDGLERGDRYLDGEVVDLDETLRFAVVETSLGPLFELRAQSEENVRYLELEGIGLALYVPNDARYNDAGHYGSKKIGAEAAWDRTRGSTAVKVAIIDSGLRKTHEEFAVSGRVLQGYDTI